MLTKLKPCLIKPPYLKTNLIAKYTKTEDGNVIKFYREVESTRTDAMFMYSVDPVIKQALLDTDAKLRIWMYDKHETEQVYESINSQMTKTYNDTIGYQFMCLEILVSDETMVHLMMKGLEVTKNEPDPV